MAKWIIGGLALLFIGVGIGFLGYGLLEIGKAQATHTWASITGELTSCELKTRHSSKSTTYRCQVAYTYEVDGTTYHSERIAYGYTGTNKRKTHDALHHRLKNAKRVKVYYNPQDPSQSVLAPGVYRSAFGTVVFGGTWLAFCIGLGVLLLLEGATATIYQRVVVLN